MNIKKLPPPEYLNKLFRYNPETGKLYRKVSVSARGMKGDEVRSVSGNGYLQVMIEGRQYYVHRIIYKIHHGVDPLKIDHISGDKTDNRAENLRSVSQAQNNRNRRIQKNNTSGSAGVGWHKPSKKWVAVIKINYKCVFLGLFTKKQDAIKARKKAEIKYGFHENHGRK